MQDRLYDLKPGRRIMGTLPPAKETSMENILIEVITPTLASLEVGCSGCQMFMGLTGLRSANRRAGAREFPPGVYERNQRLIECLSELRSLYGDRIRFRIIDAMSPQGLWKLLRHRVFKLPAWIVDGQAGYSGEDPGRLSALIDRMPGR